MTRDPERYWNPYLAGLALGAVLLATYVLMGKGLGASGASFRLGVWVANAVAPAHAGGLPAMAGAMEEHHPLNDWLVFEVAGMLVGGALAAWTAGRLRLEVLKGATFGTRGRLALAVLGGVAMGFAAKLARGCTSGQALSGGALQSVGSWAFMFSVFAGGYAAAYFLRRQWR
jgi:uncharacterized membrane protein YedE/YeeE